jgi:hypothetical protein
MSVSFDVYGIHTQKLGGAQVDMSWKSFAVPSNVTIKGVEVNKIGESYLASVARQIVASTAVPSTLFRITYRADGRSATSSVFQSQARAVSTLDFSRANIPVSYWQSAYNFSSNSITWSNTIGLGLGMSAVKTFTELGETTRESYGLFYNLTVLVSAPGGSEANGDLISTPFGDILGSLMVITILSPIIIGSAAFIYEKRLPNRTDRKRSRR